MNPTAIYSKSGKGVQEASGKTSLLKRPDRAVLSAIDGRATLADVAEKVGKSFDPEFQQLIRQLDKDGFVREVSAGSASAPAKPKPAAARPAPAAPKAPPTKPAAKVPEAQTDLDFSSLFPASKPAPPSAPPSAPPKEQESALFKARKEAEAKAQLDRDRARGEADAKARAETEARVRAEAEAKVRAAADKKIKAAREAAVRTAAETKSKAETEAKRAREEADRLRREAEAHARQVREEAERKAREEAERVRRQLEEERRQLEEERRRREEEDRREQEERAARRRREQEEEERERAEREARRRQRDEEEERERREAEARRAAQRAQQPEPQAKPQAKPQPAPPKPAAPGDGFSDTLLADLDSFTNREEDERKAKEEADRKAKAEAQAQRAREEAAQRERQDAERRRQDKEAQRRREEEEARASEEAAQAKMREEEERREQEAEERRRKVKEEDALAARATRRTETTARDEVPTPARRYDAAAPARQRRRRSWVKPFAVVLAVALVVALGAAHVMPINVQEYERLASEALGRPVKIGSARLWLFTGPQLRLERVSVGEGIGAARAIMHPSIAMLYERRKSFRLVELEGLTLPQEALGDALLAKVGSRSLRVSRIVVRGLQLPGPLPLPKGIEADISLAGDGSLRVVSVHTPEGLTARLVPRGSAVEFEANAATFTLPIAPAVSLTQFAMKGTATHQGMSIAEWDGGLLDGSISGTAQLRWGGRWSVDGVLTARGINAAVFAPALLSEGRAEGTGTFSMSDAEPARLGSSGRIEGNFTVNRGVLGSFDLSRAIQTGGRQAQGRTQFVEMHGLAIYDRGAVSLRNVTIGAGALNAGASADIAESGELSGRIVADVRTVTQTLRATLLLGGTAREPQVRN